jgi:hypothetical protein
MFPRYQKATATDNILLFLNDIVTDIKASIELFEDDTSLYVTVDTSQNAADIINRDLEKIHRNNSCSCALDIFDCIDQIMSLRIPNNIPLFQNGSNE